MTGVMTICKPGSPGGVQVEVHVSKMHALGAGKACLSSSNSPVHRKLFGTGAWPESWWECSAVHLRAAAAALGSQDVTQPAVGIPLPLCLDIIAPLSAGTRTGHSSGSLACCLMLGCAVRRPAAGVPKCASAPWKPCYRTVFDFQLLRIENVIE